ELARSHDAEARTHLVAELPLDMVKIERQILVGFHKATEDVRHHLLVGRSIEHVALMAVGDPQHLLAIVIVATALAPEFRRLDGRHQDFLRTGPILLFADDLADLVEYALSERQP